MADVDQLEEVETNSELTEEEEDERFDKEFRDKLARGTNRKSSDNITQRSSLSHNSPKFTKKL